MFAVVCLACTLLKVIAYIFFLRPLQFGELASATKGWQVFQLSTSKASADAATTPKSWGEKMIDPERAVMYELVNIEREGNKGNLNKPTCQNMIRAIAITYNDCLTESIKMIDTVIGSGPEVVRALPSLFGNVNKINSVNLTGNQLHNTMMELCEDSLSANKSIETLNFTRNVIKESGGQCLGRVISKNKAIKTLILDDNPFGTSLADMMNGLADNTALKSFRLRKVSGKDVNVQIRFGTAFGASMKRNKVLQEMDFTTNWFPAKGVAAMMEGLHNSAGNKTLLCLILESCKINDDCIPHFATMLTQNHTLQVVNFQRNEISNNGGLKIAEGLGGNKGLTALDLQNNNEFQFVTLVKIHRGGMDGMSADNAAAVGLLVLLLERVLSSGAV